MSKEKIYSMLIEQSESLINPEDPIITNLANLSALIFHSFDYINWAGFYLFHNNELVLGPFSGKVACTKIPIGNGVCGTAALKKETVIVENVHRFSGHIACDSASNSEIVVPILNENKLFGVLDIDSYEFGSFDKTDSIYLEKIINLLIQKLNLNKFEVQ